MPCRPARSAYAVAAADGSQIDMDHHGIADCWVINIGRVALIYGPNAEYRAETRPTLGYSEDDLVLRDSHSDREVRVTGDVLAARRDQFEGLRLAECGARSAGRSATYRADGRHTGALDAQQIRSLATRPLSAGPTDLSGNDA